MLSPIFTLRDLLVFSGPIAITVTAIRTGSITCDFEIGKWMEFNLSVRRSLLSVLVVIEFPKS